MTTAIFLAVVLAVLVKALLFLHRYARHESEQYELRRAETAAKAAGIAEQSVASTIVSKWTVLDDHQLQRYLAEID